MLEVLFKCKIKNSFSLKKNGKEANGSIYFEP